MKLNLGVRAKNPWFWVGLAGVVLTAMGVSPEMLTSWQAVADAARSLVTNPCSAAWPWRCWASSWTPRRPACPTRSAR